MKIKSFTISEITVAMIIVFVAVLIAYTILQNLHTDLGLFQNNENKCKSLVENYYKIKHDIDNSKLIFKNSNQIGLITQRGDTIIYIPSEENIIRLYKQNTDTINCRIKSFETNSHASYPVNNLINEIKIALNDSKENEIRFFKIYSTEILLNLKLTQNAKTNY